jgi:hypothetical protein
MIWMALCHSNMGVVNMINTAGVYILVLVLSNYQAGGLAMQEFDNYDSCKAALVQLEPVRGLSGYCIAKELIKD